MANHLDLEEQEQLDQLKHFWKQYGNLITWILIAVLGSFAAWNAYNYWQKNQSTKAAAMFDELEKVVRSGDVKKAERAFDDMKEKFSSATYTPQAGLLVAKLAYENANSDLAKASLSWVAANADDVGYVSVARLRLSGIQFDAKAYDEALKTLESPVAPEFSALVADRRGDVYIAQGKKTEAKQEYQKAYKAFDERSDYRRLVQIKLSALGVVPDGAN
jgi:predicted negative regulator of RcsB-dependent stress response